MDLLHTQLQFFNKSQIIADQHIIGKSNSSVDQSVSGAKSPTEKKMSQNQTPYSQSVEPSQSQELCSSTEYTESQKSVISLSTTSISQTNSQTSVISLSTEQSEDDMFNNVSTEPSDSDTSTTSTPNQFIDHRNFHPSVVRYCQGLTVLSGSSDKTSSTVTDIQVFMTDGSDKRLLRENMPQYYDDLESSLESAKIQPAYVLFKSNKIICILIDKIEPGQYILKKFGKKVKVMHEKVVTDKDLKNVTVSKATVSKFNGSVTDDYQRDSQILKLGSFHKQPLKFKMISTHQSLTTKLELLEQDQTQTLLEQTSPARHDKIFLQMINNAIKQMDTLRTKKSTNQKLKSDMPDNFELENDFNEPMKKKPKFQLRIVLKNKGISLNKSKINLNQDNH